MRLDPVSRSAPVAGDLCDHFEQVLSVLVFEHGFGRLAQFPFGDPAVAVGDTLEACDLEPLPLFEHFDEDGGSESESCVPVSSQAKPRPRVCTLSAPSARNRWFTEVISSSPRAEGLIDLATETTSFG